MFETKYSKVLTVLLVVIMLAIVGLGLYLGYNYYNNYKTGTDSSKYVSTFAEEVQNTTDNNVTSGGIAENIAASEANSNNGKQEKTYKGFQATVISHELDHLDGILHIDIAKQTKQLTKEERKKLREKFPYKIINKTSKYNHPKRKGE